MFLGALKLFGNRVLENSKTPNILNNIRDESSHILVKGDVTLERWKRYFKCLLEEEQEEDVKEEDSRDMSEINGEQGGVLCYGQINDTAKLEMEETIHKLKLGKAPCMIIFYRKLSKL